MNQYQSLDSQQACELDPYCLEESGRALEYPVFDQPMGGQYIAALKLGDLSTKEMRPILDFIQLTMLKYCQTGSFGTIIIFSPDSVLPPIPTIVFGFPQPPPNIQTTLPVSNRLIPIHIFNEGLESCISAPLTWTNRVPKHHDVLTVCDASLGVSNDLTEARSFGGFWKTASGTVYGLTAGHAVTGSGKEQICSPSCVEVTERLRSIIRYTTYDQAPIILKRGLQLEAQSILSKYDKTPSAYGVEVRGYTHKIVLSGPRLGEQKAQDRTYQEGVVNAHNRQLRELSLPQFSLPTQAVMKTKMDWSIFEMDDTRWVFLDRA